MTDVFHIITGTGAGSLPLAAIDPSSYFLLIWLAATPVVLVVGIYLLGCRMSHPEKMFHPVPLGPIHQQTIARYKEWLDAAKLELRTSFKFGSIVVAVFQEQNNPRFFAFMFHQKLTFSAESYLEDLTILDTSNSGALGWFPRPGAYAQSFPGVSAQETWRLHLEGEAYLAQKFGCKWVPLSRPYEEILLDAIRLRMKYNRSQSFWPFRVLYRFFVTRHQLKNRTIAQQYP